MRRLVTLGIAALIAFTLVGCGGGGGEETAAPEGGTGETPAAAPAPVATAPIADRSVPESRTFEPFPTGDFVPPDISDRIAAKQPILLFFYDAKQKGTNDQRAEIDVALENNRGLMDLVGYDIGKYSSVDNTGTAKTDAAILKDENLSDAVLLARALKVTFAPYIVIVDGQGYITYRSRGPMDAGILEPEVLRAAK